MRDQRRPVHDKVLRDIVKNPILLQQELCKINVPSLIVWGDKDRILDASAVGTMTENLKCYHKSTNLLRIARAFLSASRADD